MQQQFVGYIYITTNLLNGKFYIGKREKPYYDKNYIGSGTYLLRSIKKYGKENFTNHMLLRCKTKEELYYQEKRCIKLYNATNRKIAYNITPGGDGGGFKGMHKGIHPDKETSKKLSEKLKKYYAEHPEIIEKKRKRMSLDTNPSKREDIRKILSEQKKGSKNPRYGKKPWNYGLKYKSKPRSLESREKMRIAALKRYGKIK